MPAHGELTSSCADRAARQSRGCLLLPLHLHPQAPASTWQPQQWQGKRWRGPGAWVRCEGASQDCINQPEGCCYVTVEMVGCFPSQGLHRLLRVCPLQDQPPAVQMCAVAQGVECFLQSEEKKKIIRKKRKTGSHEEKQRHPSLCPESKRPPESFLLGALCSGGAGFISISSFDSLIYLLHPCSRANTQRRSCRRLLTGEQAGIQQNNQRKAGWSTLGLHLSRESCRLERMSRLGAARSRVQLKREQTGCFLRGVCRSPSSPRKAAPSSRQLLGDVGCGGTKRAGVHAEVPLVCCVTEIQRFPHH